MCKVLSTEGATFTRYELYDKIIIVNCYVILVFDMITRHFHKKFILGEYAEIFIGSYSFMSICFLYTPAFVIGN